MNSMILGLWLTEHDKRLRYEIIDEYENALLEWANNHQCRLDRLDVINIANKLKDSRTNE